jgi:hypothetical protein
VYFVIEPLNAGSQQNETWHAGKDRKKLDAVKEKGPQTGPLGFLQGVPKSASCDAATECMIPAKQNLAGRSG